MKRLYLWLLAATFVCSATAQQKFEQGKPNNSAYRYLDDYKGLKEYIDHEKYPNFKLGIGTTVNDYLNNSIVKNLTNKNFTETVAGNAMKMASCVDGNGNMNFNTVKNYVNTATNAGLNVYGHTLAWHSQQAKGWLLKLMADKPSSDPNDVEFKLLGSKDFLTTKQVGWTSDQSKYGFSISYDSNGLNIKCDKINPNAWDVQVVGIDNIATQTGKTCKMTMTIRGTNAGKLHSKLGDFGSNGATADIPFTTSWQDVEVNYKATMNNSFLLMQCGDFKGTIYIKSIKFEGNVTKTVPQTTKERRDTLIYAMDKWIKGMMEACNGKVMAWDLVNEAISGGGNYQGDYELQHSEGYKSGTWDVGGDAFYWQDYLGDLNYVRQACRLARKYGPEGVKLFINDYNLESDWDDNKKLKSLINWIKRWEADGVTKIDGIGTQMHINCFENSTHQNSVKSHITKMFQLMANSGKLVRVSELDMGYVRGSNRWASSQKTSDLTEAEHKKMADMYEWIIKEYLRIVPPEQQWGICQWCATDSPNNSGWRGGEPVGIWDSDYYRKHTYAGFVRGLGGVVTGIEGVTIDRTALNVKDAIYSLNGTRLKAQSLQELPAGIYIVNGKKVIK